MDDSDQDYLTEYRAFFDNLYKSVDLDNPLPVNIGKYNIAEFEITGEIISWCLEYLNFSKCPPSLIAPLCRSVLLEMEETIKKKPEICGYRAKDDDYQTLKLMQTTIKKLIEVCLRYHDNSKLCRLPPPPPVTPSVSAAAAKNIRRTMEDRHIVINDLHALFGIEGHGVASYYAVFDGHNGSDAAIYACSHVHQYLVESQHYPHNPEAAFKEAYIRADDRFIDKSNKENLKSGTTAVSILIRHDRGKVYVAWLGDSQAILVNGRNFIQLVNPHRPDHLEERERIEAMGGSVVFWGTWRVNGQLAVSRSIGDVDYKPYVTGEPDVSSYDLTGDEDFLLLACDGLWDVVSEQMAVDKVYDYLKESKGDRAGVSKSLVTAAKSLGSKDNISVVVAWLDMSTLENGHFVQEPEVDVTDDILLPSVLRNLKPSPQITSGEESGDVAGEADSGEDSEEEWNYISGKENRQPNQPQKEELSAEDMESQLNPNAAEFVPVYSTAVEPDIASSPQKGMERSLENISIPSPNDFFKEICKRPSDIGVEYETSMNGDALNNLSTKAVFGDDSVCLNSTVDSLSNNEPLKEANPFAPSPVPSFVQDHFSIPDVCAKDDFSSSDIDFKPFSPQPQEDESEICFMAGTDKQPDLISPSAPPSEPEIKVSESNVNDVSEITFGDGLNVEEIIRSKQDSPLLRESPEPGLGSGMENNVDATPEEQPDKIQEFCTIQRSLEVESSPLNHGSTDVVSSSHQGPETSVDSDSDQDDVLVCPIKKDQNIIENNKNQIDETNDLDFSHEKQGDVEVELESELVYHKDEEDFDIKDDKEVCCLRPTIKDDFVSDHSEIIIEKNNVDKLDLTEDSFEKLETEIFSKTHEIAEDENSVDEVIDHTAVVESSEFTTSGQNLHVDDTQTSKLESEVTEVIDIDHEKVEQSDILEPTKEFNNSVSESNVEESLSGFQEPVIGTSHDEQTESELHLHLEEVNSDILQSTSVELSSSPIDNILETSSVSYQESVTTEISQVDLMDHDEWSRKVTELNQEMRDSSMETDRDRDMFSEETPVQTFMETPHQEIDSEDDEPDEKLCPMKLSQNEIDSFKVEDMMSGFDQSGKNKFEVNSVPSEVTSYYHGEDPFSIKSYSAGVKSNEEISPEEKNVSASFEDVSSPISERPKEESITPVDEEVCEKQEVHEELICPMKLTPLTKETKEEDFLGIDKEDSSEQEITESVAKIENEPALLLEDQIEKVTSPSEKEIVSQEDLVCPIKQEVDLVCPTKQEVDLVCPNKIEEQTVESEKIDQIMDFSSFGQKNINSDMYETNEINYTQINSKQEEKLSINEEHDDHKINVEEQTNDISPLRKTSDEEPIIEKKSDDVEQNSSQDEIPYTDEMSSSMIDHGEDKNLPEAQSNQLDLVQELQFEVQEKQTEGDTESDSGFEIINASEASTVEMEIMRYQSEKEAGAINEKLLLDRNEAESFEKTEEYISNEVESNLVSNEILSEKAEEKESIVAKKEEVETESSPKDIPEPLERTASPAEVEPQQKTELVNGTVTPPATPPATPSPGLKEEGAKEGLIAAAVAAAGAATVVAAVAATAASESKVEVKKSPVKKADAPTPKAGTAAKVPLKAAPSKDKAPIGKPATPSSKPSTPSSKPLAKPSSPSAKTASASKTSTLTTAKPSTPTSKLAAKPATSKPSTPTGSKAAPAAAKPKPSATAAPKPPLSKPATSAPAAKKPAAPSATAAKTTSTSLTQKPAAAKPSAAAKPLASKPAPAKPAALAKAPAAKPAAPKPAVTKTTPSSTLKPSSPSQRPSSAKNTAVAAAAPKSTTTAAKPLAKAAPAKPAAAAKPSASATGAKPAAKPPVKAAPPAPINKKPAAPTAIKKPAPTDKSTKEANNKLTAKTALNKKIVDKKVISKKEVIDNEELPSQVAIVTTTNGHISLIENGMPPVEIAEEAK
ncbi:uncharacterized protein [Halyomorpha halys]|uniref:uncharacterized protein isoform X2 n=1 Tax=Halyomorpha halys TaxID=286706 RepID=UPI0006D5125F|nr:adventurous-gliding motility protein Z-like isoform X2 [Halyomorpha halys]